VLIGLVVTFGRHSQTIGSSAPSNESTKLLQEKKNRFPTADYDEPDPSDPQKDYLRKEKQKRHNDFKIVTNKPQEWQAERVFVGEGALNFPALPVAESAYIVLGKVVNAEAHLSENKKNVYSEFTVLVERVFKTARSSVIGGNTISADRIGGFVKYPNGQKLLYRIASTNMPAVNERYLFFLVSKNDQDLSILTAYALSSVRVEPLDESPQFEAMRGLTEEALIQKLLQLLSTSPYNK